MKLSKFVMYNVKPMPMFWFIKFLFSHWPLIGDGKLYPIIENMENQTPNLLQIMNVSTTRLLIIYLKIKLYLV